MARPSATAIFARLLTSIWSAGPFLRARLRRHRVAPTFLVVSHHHLSRERTVPRATNGPVALIHPLVNNPTLVRAKNVLKDAVGGATTRFADARPGRSAPGG